MTKGAAVDAADPAGGEDPDPGGVRAIIVAETVVAAQPPSASAIARLWREPPCGRCRPGPWPVPRGRRRPGLRGRARRGSRRWRAPRPTLPHGRLRRARDFHVLGVRQAVADQRRFEGDDGAAVAQGVGDLGCDGETVGAEHGGGYVRAARGRRTVGPAGTRRRRTTQALCASRPVRRSPAPTLPRVMAHQSAALATTRLLVLTVFASRSSSRSTTSPPTDRSPWSRAAAVEATTTVSRLWLVAVPDGVAGVAAPHGRAICCDREPAIRAPDGRRRPAFSRAGTPARTRRADAPRVRRARRRSRRRRSRWASRSGPRARRCGRRTAARSRSRPRPAPSV